MSRYTPREHNYKVGTTLICTKNELPTVLTPGKEYIIESLSKKRTVFTDNQGNPISIDNIWVYYWFKEENIEEKLEDILRKLE